MKQSCKTKAYLLNLVSFLCDLVEIATSCVMIDLVMECQWQQGALAACQKKSKTEPLL